MILALLPLDTGGPVSWGGASTPRPSGPAARFSRPRKPFHAIFPLSAIRRADLVPRALAVKGGRKDLKGRRGRGGCEILAPNVLEKGGGSFTRAGKGRKAGRTAASPRRDSVTEGHAAPVPGDWSFLTRRPCDQPPEPRWSHGWGAEVDMVARRRGSTRHRGSLRISGGRCTGELARPVQRQGRRAEGLAGQGYIRRRTRAPSSMRVWRKTRDVVCPRLSSAPWAHRQKGETKPRRPVPGLGLAAAREGVSVAPVWIQPSPLV